MSSVIIIAGILTCVAAGVALVLAIRRFASPSVTLPPTAEWIDELSIEHYRPMLRLLDDAEVRFLRAHSGFTPKLAACFRRQRCQIFRGYLKSLSSDFGRICMALKVLMMQASIDRPDLAAALIRSRMMFAYGMAMARLQLVLFRLGIGTVDVAGLLKVFDAMRLELRSLVPAPVSSAA